MFGPMTGHTVGIAMKEMVRRAINEIRKQRFFFEEETKLSYAGEPTDLVTSADHAAQRIYIRLLRECFPGYGIVSEEDDLREACRLEHDLWFTVDPLDGTKAFGRRQSTGVGTMLALLHGDEVIAAYVGDVMTQEIYGFRPDTDKVHRISEFEMPEPLEIDEWPMRKGALVLRTAPWNYELDVQRFADGRFHDVVAERGSIGLTFARLWKQEVAAILLRPSFETPWDSAPILGISRKLGFVCLKVGQEHPPELVDLAPPREILKRPYEMLVVHSQHLHEFGL